MRNIKIFLFLWVCYVKKWSVYYQFYYLQIISSMHAVCGLACFCVLADFGLTILYYIIKPYLLFDGITHPYYNSNYGLVYVVLSCDYISIP